VRSFRTAKSKVRQNSSFKSKKYGFLRSTKFKLLRQIYVNAVDSFDFFKFRNSCGEAASYATGYVQKPSTLRNNLSFLKFFHMLCAHVTTRHTPQLIAVSRTLVIYLGQVLKCVFYFLYGLKDNYNYHVCGRNFSTERTLLSEKYFIPFHRKIKTSSRSNWNRGTGPGGLPVLCTGNPKG
jgi:hypothetical protein